MCFFWRKKKKENNTCTYTDENLIKKLLQKLLFWGLHTKHSIDQLLSNWAQNRLQPHSHSLFYYFGIAQLDSLEIPLQKQNHMCKLNTKSFIVHLREKSFKNLKLRADYALVCMNVWNNPDKILASVMATSIVFSLIFLKLDSRWHIYIIQN